MFNPFFNQVVSRCGRLAWFNVCLFLVTVPASALGGTSNSLMDISADGKLLICSNRDNGTVTIVDLETNTKRKEIQVGDKPEGVSFIGKSHRFACCVYGEDKVVLADADTGAIEKSVPVFDEPYGIVSATNGQLFVTLDYPGQVIKLHPDSGAIEQRFDAGKFVRGIAVNTDGTRLWCTEYYTGLVRSLDANTGEQLHEWPGRSSDNLLRQLIIHPTRPKAYLPHIRSRVTFAHGSGSIFPYVSVLDLEPIDDDERTRIPMDSFRLTQVTANPWECAITNNGKLFFVVFGGTDDMFVCDVVDDDYNEIDFKRSLSLGRNPRAVRVSPDDQTFYVYNALDFQVVAYDTSSLRKTAVIDVCDNPLSPEMLRGKVLFYTARQPMAARKWISCSGCHPDGDTDGRTWQNPEGLRNTPPLNGLAFTHPLHWSADRDEVQDFEHTIRGPLMQGRGLIRRRSIHDALGKPLSGQSADLDALAVYTNSHKPALSPYAKNGLTASAERGRTLFFSKETGCANCHNGPFFTDSRPENEFRKHDVGTGRDDPSELMGTAYDTPMLIGLYRSAPYLHDGSAATLHDVIRKTNPKDKHGKTSHLKDNEVDDLVSFLRALPYSDTVAAAKKAKLTKIEK